LLAGQLLSFVARFHRGSAKNYLAQFVAQPLSFFCIGGTTETLDKLLKFSPLLFLGPDSRAGLTGLFLWRSHDISMH